MPTISINRRHKLPHTKARAAAQKIAKDLNKRFDLVCSFEGDNVAFERPGLSGTMRVGKSDIQLDVRKIRELMEDEDGEEEEVPEAD